MLEQIVREKGMEFYTQFEVEIDFLNFLQGNVKQMDQVLTGMKMTEK